MSSSSKRWLLVLNFACIYLVWGSTFLGIKYAISELPPFLMVSVRFMLAGGVLFLMGRWRREEPLPREDWGIALASGILMVLGNALLSFAERDVSSNLAAVVVGTTPGWIMILKWKLFGGDQPKFRQFLGLSLALLGVLLLTRSQSELTHEGSVLSWVALTISILAWALGTLLARTARHQKSLFTFSSLQLGFGGTILFATWMIFGSPSEFQISAVTMTSLWALAYLTLVGSVAAFTSYVWLNRNVDATVVSTYALVNPIVAVWLGWAFAGEIVTLKTLLFSFLILTGIYLIVIQRSSRKIIVPEAR